MKPKSAINRLRPYTPIIKNPLLNSANSASSNRIKYNSNDSLSNFNNNKLRYIDDIENEKQSSLSKDLNAFLKVSQLSQRTEKRSKCTKTTNQMSTSMRKYYNLEYVPKSKIKPELITFETPKAQSNPIPIINDKKTTNKKDNSNEYYSTINENEFLRFRTGYILKYAQNSELIDKMGKYQDYIGEERKNLVTDLYGQMKHIYDRSSREFFQRVKREDVINYETWKNMITIYDDFSIVVLKLFSLVFAELKGEKEKNLKLEKKCFEQDNMLKTKNSELNEINQYITKYELTSKVKQRKKRDSSVISIKHGFVKKENAYVLTIYRLEDEIRDLTTLLENNKKETSKLTANQEMIDKKDKEIDEMRMKYNKEINDLNIKITVYKGEIETLNDKIAQLEKQNEDVLEKRDEQLKLLIEANAQKTKLKELVSKQENTINELSKKIQDKENKDNAEEENRQAFIKRIETLQKENSDIDI